MNTNNNNTKCNVDLSKREFTWYTRRFLVLTSMLKIPHVVGSASMQAFPFFKDLDSMESVDLGIFENRAEAIESVESKLLSIIRRILLSQEFIFLELKCGYDKNFEKIFKSTDKTILRELNKIKEYITTDDTKEIHNLVKSKDYEAVREYIRKKYYILRWSIDELMKKQKELSNGRMITLKEAISHRAMLKLDGAVFLKYNYREISNIYTITYQKNGKIYHITDKVDANYFPNGSIQQVKYYLDKDKLKCIKRLFMLCKFILHDKSSKYDSHKESACEILHKIEPIMKEEPAMLDRLLDECEVLIKILSVLPRQFTTLENRMPIYKNILFQIEGFMARIPDSINTSNEERKVVKQQINTAVSHLNEVFFDKAANIGINGQIRFKIDESDFVSKLENMLESLINILEPIIVKSTMRTMKKYDLSDKNILEFVDSINCIN